MKIFLTGGIGFIGSILRRELMREGHGGTLLVRSAEKRGASLDGVPFVEGTPTEPGKRQEKVAEHDAFVNLAGASIFRR